MCFAIIIRCIILPISSYKISHDFPGVESSHTTNALLLSKSAMDEHSEIP